MSCTTCGSMGGHYAGCESDEAKEWERKSRELFDAWHNAPKRRMTADEFKAWRSSRPDLTSSVSELTETRHYWEGRTSEPFSGRIVAAYHYPYLPTDEPWAEAVDE